MPGYSDTVRGCPAGRGPAGAGRGRPAAAPPAARPGREDGDRRV